MVPTKAALRAQVSAALAALAPPTVVSQSAQVLAHLRTMPAFTQDHICAAVYLPMDGGCEVDTWPILQDLLARGVSVAVPRVTGKGSHEMSMYRLSGGLEQAKGLPRTKWGIPEPDAALAANMEDVTDSADLSLIITPVLAFDSRCGRLGHGRGYYDAFIAKQRLIHARSSLAGKPPLQVVGLGLREQLVEQVPMEAGRDERMDLVVTPDGPMAYTSEADVATAAAMMAAGAAGATAVVAVDVSDETEKKRARGAESTQEENSPAHEAAGTLSGGATALNVRCDIAEGKFKYACLRIKGLDGESFIAVRSGPGSYHADVAAPAIDMYRKLGYSASPLGGGRIVRTAAPRRTVHIYGYSVGFGGGEGGPPGRGMADHSQVAALARQALPDYEVTFSADGY